MRAVLIFALITFAWGCHHDNTGQMGAPDASVDDTDMFLRIDDLAGLEAAVCGTNSKKAEQVGLDVVFAVDNSYSMDFNLKWQEVSAALESFLGDPKFNGLGVGIQYFPLRAQCNVADYAVPAVPVATLPSAALESFLGDPKFNGLGVGIQYFPLRAQCNVADYAVPAVPVATLPSAAPALIADIQSRRMSGGTALVPALTGILQYAATVNPAGSSRRTVVILATDGAPDNTCLPHDDGGMALDPIAVTAGIVQAAAKSTPPIVTYVIGVGSDLTALNTIAAAGGGAPSAFLVDINADIEAQFRDALDAIRKQALVCDFIIPDPAPGLHIDYDKVNVTFSDPDTMSQTQFVYVGSQADCAKAPNTGWYYDDPMNPTQVVLCDGACEQVRDSDNGHVDIVFGCAQIIP
jgi:hypothetical protein